MDGKLAISSDHPLLFGDERWDSMRGAKSFDVFKWLMSTQSIQATLEGSNSFVRESDTPEPLPSFDGDPSPLYKDFLPNEIIQRDGHRGWFTAVDSRGRIRWMYKDGYPGDDSWEGWYALVLVTERTPPSYLAYLQAELIPYLVCGIKRVDLVIAFEKMKNLLKVKTILSTAGGELNGALLKAGLVDEINIEFLPGVIGGNEAPYLFSGHNLDEEGKPTQLELLSCTSQSGGQVWLRFIVKNGTENGN